MEKCLRLFVLLALALPLSVAAQCGPNLLETWESGTYAPTWIAGTAPITWNVGTASPAVGSYSLTGTGGISSHLQGLRHTFPAPITPNYISWYMKPDGTTADNYVVVGNSTMTASSCIAFCYWVGTAAPAQIRFVSSITYGYTPPATGVWYHIEMKNINYVAHTFDIWINGALMYTAFPFRSTTQNDLSQIHLYNFSTGSTGYWDQIQVGNGSGPTGSITTLDPLCFGDSTGACDLTVVGGTAPISYAWSTGAITEDISGWPAGTYEVVVTDGLGCKDTVDATIVEPPALGFGGTVVEPTCFGDSTGSIDLSPSGGTPGYEILWGLGDTTFMISGIPAGTYAFTLSDTNGCLLSDSLLLTEPTAVSATSFSTDVLCFGDSNGTASVLGDGGVPGYTYLWSTGDTTDSLSGLAPGTYDITVTDTLGCIFTSSITIDEPTAVSILDSLTMPLCNGDTNGIIFLTASGGTPGYTYLWSTGDSTDMLVGVGAGTYLVTVTDDNGCVLSDTVVLGEPAAIGVSTVVTDAVGGVGGAIDLTVSGGTPGYTYAWSNGATTEDISSLANGTYTVTITDSNGCTFVHTDTVDFVVGITDAHGNSAACFPNPFSHDLNWSIQVASAGVATLQLMDLRGTAVIPVMIIQLNSGENKFNLPMLDLPSGVYLWQVAGEDFVLTGKVVRAD